MNISLNKTDNVNGVITIEIEKADYQGKVEEALNRLRHQVNIPGFRQGKVPKGIIEKMYGKTVLADELSKILNDELFKYIRENNLPVLGEPLAVENEENKIDFEKDENFTFSFDIALSPEFELSLTHEDKLTYYHITLDEETLQDQINAYLNNYGTYEAVDEPALEDDLLKGTLTELENGEPKENGMVVENAVIMPLYVKDEETRKQLIGAKVGDKIVLNPKKAYDNNEAEIASLLQTTKDKIQDIDSDFSYEIKEITRYKKPEMNQEFFDKLLGEGAVSSEEEFKSKVRDLLNTQFTSSSDYLFIRDLRNLILDKMKDVQLPEEFLKRWLLESNKESTPESIEKEFPRILDDLKFSLAKNKIIKEQNIEVSREDVEALGNETAKTQFIQYGILNIREEFLEDYVKNMLSNEKTVNDLYQQTLNKKIIEGMKQTVDVEEKEITSKELSDMLEKEKEKEKETEIKAETETETSEQETESLKSKEAKAAKEGKEEKEDKEGKAGKEEVSTGENQE